MINTNNDITIFSINTMLYRELQELDEIVNKIVFQNNLNRKQNEMLTEKMKQMNRELKFILSNYKEEVSNEIYPKKN